jgi:hypothetical protein
MGSRSDLPTTVPISATDRAHVFEALRAAKPEIVALLRRAG